MAKIPLAQGQEQITRQPLATRAEPGIFSTKVAQASQEFAQTAADVMRQFEEAQTLAEKTKADTEATRRLAELQLEAETTEDIWNIQEFKNKIGKVRADASKLVTLPQAKNEFGRIFDRDSTLAEFNIRKTLRSRQIDATVTDINENVSALRETFITGDANMRQVAETKRNVLLGDAVSRGIIKADSARKSRDAMAKEWRLAKIDADIESDTEFALEQLQLGNKGIYADTDASDRLTKETRANTKLERNKKIAEKLTNERHTANEIDLTQKFFANQLTFDEIQGQFIDNNISQKYAGVLNTALTSPNAVDARTDDKEFGKLITAYLSLDESKLDDLRKFRVKTLGFHAAGLLSRNDAEFLVNRTVDPFTQQKAEGKGFLATAIEAIKSWGKTGVPPFGITHMVDKLFNRVNEQSPEETIVEAGQNIIAEEQRALYPGYDVEDLEFTAQELNLTVRQVYEMLQKRTGIEK